MKIANITSVQTLFKQTQLLNYLVWIANLGVVPLFLFFCFLPRPAFFDLRSLLTVVTPVLDTIKTPQYYINAVLLPKMLFFVKAIVVFSLYLDMAAASEQIYLGVGEHAEISISPTDKYSIGTPNVVAHKVLENKKILIKGKNPGTTELIVIGINSTQTYNIRVDETKKISDLPNSIKAQNNVLSGKISGEKALCQLKNIYEKNIYSFSKSNISIDHKLKTNLVTEIYQYFFKRGIEQVECIANQGVISCLVEEIPELYKNEVNELAKKKCVIINSTKVKGQVNYKIRLKIVQLENLSGKEVGFGLDKIDAGWGDIFTLGTVGILSRNQIFINEQNLNVSTLGEPEAILRLDNELQIQVGAEVPYKMTASENAGGVNRLEWKFAGLSVKITLRKIGTQYMLEYQTEFTRPSADGSISGSKQKSTLVIIPFVPIEIFKIGYQTEADRVSALPGVNSIPIIGELFKSKGKEKTYKNITGLVQLERMDD
jgi:Flp pilus assembly secretin CpaC